MSEIAEVKQNEPRYVSDINWYTQLKTEQRFERMRLAEVAAAARSQEAVATRAGTGSSQNLPMVLAILGDPENNSKIWTLQESGAKYL